MDDLRGVVPDECIEAAKSASEAFRRAGVRHALVGGLAVGMNGYPRNTSDVDFLVGEEAFEHHGLLVSPKPGLPIRYGKVIIDWVSLDESDRDVLEEFLVAHGSGDEVVAIPPAPLVLMKLMANRQRDRADVVELLKAGADADAIEAFIELKRPDLHGRFIQLRKMAAEEE